VASVFGANTSGVLRQPNALDFDDPIGEDRRGGCRAFPPDRPVFTGCASARAVFPNTSTNHASNVLVRELVGHGAGSSLLRAATELWRGRRRRSVIYALPRRHIRNIEDFDGLIPTTRTILLEQNYSSTQKILSAAKLGDRAQHRFAVKNCCRPPAPASRSSATSPTTSTTRPGFRGRGERRSRRALRITSTTWRCSIAPTTRRGSLEEVSSAPGSRTSRWGVRFYSAKGFATSRLSGCWTTLGMPVSMRRIQKKKTIHHPRRGIGIGPRSSWRCTPRTPAPASRTALWPRRGQSGRS